MTAPQGLVMYMSSGPVFGQVAILSAGLSCAAAACKLLGHSAKRANWLYTDWQCLYDMSWWLPFTAVLYLASTSKSLCGSLVYFCLGVLCTAHVRPSTRKTGQGRSVSLSREEGA